LLHIYKVWQIGIFLAHCIPLQGELFRQSIRYHHAGDGLRQATTINEIQDKRYHRATEQGQSLLAHYAEPRGGKATLVVG
jgi:hypothetical protein